MFVFVFLVCGLLPFGVPAPVPRQIILGELGAGEGYKIVLEGGEMVVSVERSREEDGFEEVVMTEGGVVFRELHAGKEAANFVESSTETEASNVLEHSPESSYREITMVGDDIEGPLRTGSDTNTNVVESSTKADSDVLEELIVLENDLEYGRQPRPKMLELSLEDIEDGLRLGPDEDAPEAGLRLSPDSNDVLDTVDTELLVTDRPDQQPQQQELRVVDRYNTFIDNGAEEVIELISEAGLVLFVSDNLEDEDELVQEAPERRQHTQYLMGKQKKTASMLHPNGTVVVGAQEGDTGYTIWWRDSWSMGQAIYWHLSAVSEG